MAQILTVRLPVSNVIKTGKMSFYLLSFSFWFFVKFRKINSFHFHLTKYSYSLSISKSRKYLLKLPKNHAIQTCPPQCGLLVGIRIPHWGRQVCIMSIYSLKSRKFARYYDFHPYRVSHFHFTYFKLLHLEEYLT